MFLRCHFRRDPHFRGNRGFPCNPLIFTEIREFHKKPGFPWKRWFCRKWHPGNLNNPIGIPCFSAPAAKGADFPRNHGNQNSLFTFHFTFYKSALPMVFRANPAPSAPTPEHQGNHRFHWCFWGAFHWKAGISSEIMNSTHFTEFCEFPWNSMNSTRIHDSHGNGDGIRRCEGSRNLSIPIGLLRFSRRGRQGSALFQEILVSGGFLVILVIYGDFWWIPLKMEEIGGNGAFYPPNT